MQKKKKNENAQKSLIKDENKKKLEPINNEEQWEVLGDELTVVDKKSKEIVLLKLNFIFEIFDSNFYSSGKRFLTKLAKDEKRLIIIICFLK